jgi:epoxide hydrolase-like predicted phosphatase
MTTKKPIKALGFDIGGVMLPYSIPQQKQFIADSIGVELDDVLRAYRKYLPLLEIAALDTVEFWQGLIDETGSAASAEETLHIWTDNYIRENPVLPQMVHLIDRLKKGGYRTGILSNIDASHGVINLHRHIFEHFDEVLLSYQVGVRKPDSAAFRLLANRLNVELDELIFVDDLQLNIDAALAIGIDAIHFESYDQLIPELIKRGVIF